MFSRRSFVRPLAAVGVLSLVACGTKGTPMEPEPLAVATVAPTSGAPGTAFVVGGLALTPEDVASAELRVGGRASPLVLSPSGQLLGAVPLLAAGSDGATPPAQPVDIELYRDGEPFAAARSAFTVQALPRADGSTATLGTTLGEVGTELALVADMLFPDPGVEDQWFRAVTAAVTELTSGTDAAGLPAALAALQAADPGTLRLIDGVVASSGTLARTQALLEGLRSLTAASPAASAPTRAPSVEGADVLLARKMQFYVVAKLFGETVIGETAEDYAYTMGLASGLIGIGADVPGTAVIGATIAVVDFAVNKVLLGLLPAVITDFTLTLEDPVVQMGATTLARVDIAARNDPPEVGIQDFVGLTLNLIGVGANAQTQTFKDFLTNTAAFYLSTVQQFLSTYSSNHPELELDISVELVPDLTWEATVHDPRLVERVSLDPDLIASADGEVNWRAATDQVGSGDIFARTALGSEALLLDLLPGFSYVGGAFGEEVRSSETLTVQVVGALALEIDLDPVIEPGQSKPLAVRAGYTGNDGIDVAWTGGLAVGIAVEGGTVQLATGVTAADGTFETLAGLAPGSAELILSITVTDSAANSVTRTVTAAPSGTLSLSVEAWESTVPSGQDNLLRLYAGSPSGPVAGAFVELTLIGATVSSLSGVTDGAGYFETPVSFAEGSDSLQVDVTVTAPGFDPAGTVLYSSRLRGRVLLVKNRSYAEVAVDAADCFDKRVLPVDSLTFASVDFSWTISCAGSAQGESHFAQQAASGSITFDMVGDTNEALALGISATASGTRTMTGLASNGALVRQDVEFLVEDAPVKYIAIGSIASEPGLIDRLALSRESSPSAYLYSSITNANEGIDNISVDQEGWLIPGRYYLSTSLWTADNAMDTVDFEITFTP